MSKFYEVMRLIWATFARLAASLRNRRPKPDPHIYQGEAFDPATEDQQRQRDIRLLSWQNWRPKNATRVGSESPWIARKLGIPRAIALRMLSAGVYPTDRQFVLNPHYPTFESYRLHRLRTGSPRPPFAATVWIAFQLYRNYWNRFWLMTALLALGLALMWNSVTENAAITMGMIAFWALCLWSLGWLPLLRRIPPLRWLSHQHWTRYPWYVMAVLVLGFGGSPALGFWYLAGCCLAELVLQGLIYVRFVVWWVNHHEFSDEGITQYSGVFKQNPDTLDSFDQGNVSRVDADHTPRPRWLFRRWINTFGPGHGVGSIAISGKEQARNTDKVFVLDGYSSIQPLTVFAKALNAQFPDQQRRMAEASQISADLMAMSAMAAGVPRDKVLRVHPGYAESDLDPDEYTSADAQYCPSEPYDPDKPVGPDDPTGEFPPWKG